MTAHPNILQICSIINLVELVNAKLSQQIFKSSQHKYKYSHKFEQYKYKLMPFMQNLATKNLFVTKYHSKEAIGLIMITGMLIIWKDLSFPQKLKLVENLHAMVYYTKITIIHKKYSSTSLTILTGNPKLKRNKVDFN